MPSLLHCGLALCLIGLLPPSTARAGCTPTSPTDGATVTCSGTDSTGYDGSSADKLTITTSGAAVLDDSNPTLDSAIRVEDNSKVTIGAGATVRVTEQNGYGIRGDDDNFVDNKGRIELNADDTRGISIDQNTTGVLPNGAVSSGTIEVNGDRSRAIEAGDNSGVFNSGIINLRGDEDRGLSIGNRTDTTKPADITNSGEINVDGLDSIGIRVGDGWTGTMGDADGNPQTPPAYTPNLAATRNFGQIFVSGDRSTGIFAGDETNSTGKTDSNVSNAGTIDVSGSDAIGISLGGNDKVDRFDITPGTITRLTIRPALNSSTVPQDLVTFENGGTIQGSANAGPLVVFRSFFGARENRLINQSNGVITADLTNQGTTDRGIAIRGSDGIELIVNAGRIQGDIQLLGGDDRYVQNSGAQSSGTIDGGAGQDELILTGTRTTADTFDLARLNAFETVRIMGVTSGTNVFSTPWRLSHSEGFTGATEILDYGTLDVPTAITLGGSLSVAAKGTIQVTLNDSTPPLTVNGASTFDGNLVVRKGASLTPSTTPYRVILASGGYTGQFANIRFPDASGTRIFTPSYDALGVLALFQDVGLVGVARNSNQRAIAQNLFDLQTAGGNSGDLQQILDGLDDTQNLGMVYNALSPEPYDAQTTVSVEAGRRIAALLFDRPRECRTGEVDPWNPNPRVLPCHTRRFSPWAATVGSFRSRDKFGGHNRYEAKLGGLVAGVDVTPLAGLDLTFAVSSQRGGIDVAHTGESTLTLAELTGAAAWNQGPLRVQGAVSWGHGFHQDRRRIMFQESATAVDVRGVDDHDSDRALVATEIGYLIPTGPVNFEPIAGFDWAWMNQNGIHETGAGGLGLEVYERDDQIGSVRAGFRLSSVYEHKTYLGPWLEWMTGVWRPTFDLAWRQFVEGNQRDVGARLLGATDTVGGFKIRGKEDSGGAEIGVGFRLVPKEANRVRLDVRYQAYVAEHTLEQDLVGQATIAF